MGSVSSTVAGPEDVGTQTVDSARQYTSVATQTDMQLYPELPCVVCDSVSLIFRFRVRPIILLIIRYLWVNVDEWLVGKELLLKLLLK